MNAAKRISNARSKLLLDHRFWGFLGMRLRMVENPKVPTMGTDGTTLQYNPDFVMKLTDKELEGVIAHEIGHCAFRHMYRKKGRNHHLWNIAGDYAINQILQDSKITLPSDCLLDPRFKGMGAEQIYSILIKEIKEQDRKSGGGCCSGDCGLEDPVPGQGMTEADWSVAVSQAAGLAPAGMERIIADLKKVKTPWKEILRRFVTNLVPHDQCWSNPNRRYIGEGLYLPGVLKESCPKFAIGFDTSGSVDTELATQFASEITDILVNLKPEAVDVYYCDAKVHKVDRLTPDDNMEIKLVGGGGTLFGPVFKAILESREEYAAILYFTDLEAGDVPEDPGIPTLWIAPEPCRLEGPFGETLVISR